MELNWKPVMADVRSARAQPGLVWRGDTGGSTIGEMLRVRCNIDVHDRRQLNYLIQCLGLWTPVVAEAALDVRAYGFFGLDEIQSSVLSFAVLQASAVLTLNLSEYLPTEVRSGRVKREQVFGTPIDPSTFNWSTLVPGPDQIQRHDEWRRDVSTRDIPGLVAARDQAGTMLRDSYEADSLYAYMSAVARMFVVLLATAELDPDEVPTESALRFRDVVAVTTFDTLPAKFQALADAE
jgi:hypothetical protein